MKPDYSLGCTACKREIDRLTDESDVSVELTGHSCGRLDRLGGVLIVPRTADHTSAAMLPGFRLCLICRIKTNGDGICADPTCWDRIRDRYPHHVEVKP